MDNNYLIEETKKVLESYSNAASELEKLYERAVTKTRESYELAKNELARSYEAEKNAASVKALMDNKDMGQFLAARGLASSGESVQAKIDSGVAASRAMSELAGKHAQSITGLERERIEKESGLDSEKEEKRLDLLDKQNQLAQKIASLKDSAAQAAKDAKTGSSGSSGGTEDKTETYAPGISAQELAKRIMGTYSPDGGALGEEQNGKVTVYIKSLEEDGVSVKYLKELLINLKALGYTEQTYEKAEAGELAQSAKEFYDKNYSMMYEVHIRSGNSMKKAVSLAEEYAKERAMDYVYRRSGSISQFEQAAKALGATSAELKEYYRRVENINKEKGNVLVMGSDSGK